MDKIAKTATSLLEGAYAIQTPKDSLRYYQDFANHYDTDFAQQLGYVYPQAIAGYYDKIATPTDRPVADIGCGTGLVAEALNLPATDIEGFDISPEMLATAERKGIYNALHQVDLTQTLNNPKPRFGAVVSAGAFTHGHLGPEPLIPLLDIAAQGGLFCIGVNAQHYAAKGFDPVLGAMVQQGRITKPVLEEVPIYADPTSPHGADRALVLLYRKQ